MLVTVGICCFNSQYTIVRAVKSAQALTWPELEILIVDDGSTDQSVDLISEIARNDDRVRLVKHDTNLGTGATRSTIVREAKGEYLAFLDDDDECMPNRIEIQLASLETVSGQLKACFGRRMAVSPDGNQTLRSAMGSKGEAVSGKQVALHALTGEKFDGDGYVGTCTLMAPLTTFHAVGDFDPLFRRHQDRDWAVRLALQRGIFTPCSEQVIVQYITHSEDKSETLRFKMERNLIHKHRTFLKSEHAYLAAVGRVYEKHFRSTNRPMLARLAALAQLLTRPVPTLRRYMADRQ